MHHPFLGSEGNDREKGEDSRAFSVFRGIFGIGETDEDRVDLAFTLRELQVDSIPLNFYVPVPAASVVPEHLSGEKS